MEFRNILKQRRTELNLTLEEVGKAVGVSKATVQRWESGVIENIRRDKIASLAQVLQISPVLLVGSAEESLPKKTAEPKVTKTELRLLDSFRRLDKDGQIDVIEYVEFKAHKSKSVLRDKPSTTIIDAPFQVRAAHAHDPNSDGSELKGDFDMLEEAVKNDKLRKNGKKK